jgi:hypothetical protein
MSGRVNPFADLTSPLPSFTVKPRKEKPVEEEAIARIAAENNFPSRQTPKISREPKRKRRVYTTGRNRQFNIKATAETVERFYAMADERKVPLCELLEQALDALDREGVPARTA